MPSPNVDLRSGKFRKAVSDEDLGRLIATGVPGTAMPPHKFQDAELTGIVAYIRAMRDVRAATVAAGRRRDAARKSSPAKARASTCHRVNGQGSRVAPDLSDIGIIRSAERPPAIAARSHRQHAADQSFRARRDQGRQGDHRPPSQ